MPIPAPLLFWPIALGLLGAILGSFIATLVIRWPLGRSVARGRSACDACGRMLTAAELIPLVSAAVARGRCRTCGARIDPRHWQIELAALLVGIAAGITTPSQIGIAGAVFGWLLLALAALDLTAFWLPDRLTVTLALGGIAVGLLGVAPGMTDRLIGGVAGYGSLWAIATVYRLVRRREGIGGGDPKLFGGIGLWLGWQALPIVLLAASLIGLAVALVAHLRGRAIARDTAMPLGTLLAIAAYPAWLVMIGLRP